MGATTRGPNGNIPVEAGTPPIFKDEGHYKSASRLVNQRVAEGAGKLRGLTGRAHVG